MGERWGSDANMARHTRRRRNLRSKLGDDVCNFDAKDERAKKKVFSLLAVANPGAVSCYCVLKLEMAVELTRVLISRQLQSTSSVDTTKYSLGRDLTKQLGVEVDASTV